MPKPPQIRRAAWRVFRISIVSCYIVLSLILLIGGIFLWTYGHDREASIIWTRRLEDGTHTRWFAVNSGRLAYTTSDSPRTRRPWPHSEWTFRKGDPHPEVPGSAAKWNYGTEKSQTASSIRFSVLGFTHQTRKMPLDPTTRATASYVPCSWVVVIGLCALTPLIFRVRKNRIHRLRRKKILCQKCGYDLRATPDKCPECGTPVPPSRPPADSTSAPTTTPLP
jgi:hypothetical protein